MRSKLSSFLILMILSCSSCLKNNSTELIFADASDVWWTAPTIIAQTHNCFDKDKLTLKTFNVTSGLASKNAVVSGTAEIGLVAATPLAMGAYKEKTLRILCSYVESRSLIAFLKRPSDNSLLGESIPEPVAIVPRTISEWYFENYLEAKKLNRSNIQRLYVTPPDVPNVLKTGKAKSAVIWEPFASLALKDLKASGLEAYRDPNLYSVCLFLITREDVLKNKPEAVKAFIAGVKKACDEFINKEPEGIMHELENHFGYPENFLSDLWFQVDFSVKTDTSRMRDLIIKDANLALKLNYTPEKILPEIDYLFESIGK